MYVKILGGKLIDFQNKSRVVHHKLEHKSNQMVRVIDINFKESILHGLKNYLSSCGKKTKKLNWSS